MSTEPKARGRAATRTVTSLVVWSSAWASAGAAEVDFRPELTFGVFHDGNVAVIGDATDRGDQVALLSVDLAVARNTPVSALSFSFIPSYAAYQDHQELSYFGQSTGLSYQHSGSRQATYSFDLDASRTERQGADLQNPSEATTFVPRSTEMRAVVRGRGEHRARRNIVDWEIRFGLDNFSDASGGVPASSTLQDSKNLGVLTSWSYAVSEKSSVGLGVDAALIDYESLATTDVESIGLVGAYTFDRFTSMTYEASVSRAGSDAFSRTLAAGELTVTRTITEISSLSAGIRRAISPGSGLGASSVDAGAYIGYSHAAPRRGLSGSIVAAYWKRDPTFSGTTTTPPPGPTASDASTTTISTDERLQWSFNRFLSLEIAHAYHDQSSPDVNALVTSYNSYGFDLRWSILGRLEPRP